MASQPDGNILIVDDQENWRKVLTHLLKDRYNVQAISNYEDAEQVIAQSTFDVIVLDVRLVDKDIFNVSGLALLEKIKKHKPDTGVVVLTGYPDSVRKEILQEYDADVFFSKAPEGKSFDTSGFKALIQDLVAQYRV